ncbi:MAG: hypothetical protein DI628_05825 [Blastochloris viridis]|uniref:Cell wall hydrolase SleB domain-containing protein n=1 Tax=Blastochloris viridis TaxID=1079 RepID=A0A6N4R9E4_BLAVI|nr:MAG: hypothetical protein DI628_05825 [Blastochloris viridis]
MNFLKVMMFVTMTLVLQMASAHAGSTGKLPNPQENALVHVAVTEGYLDYNQIKAIVQTVSNRAYYYGDATNVSRVVYDKKEMFGPQDKKTPWVGSEAERFKETAEILQPYFGKLKKGEIIAPHLATAWHFDMKYHPEWGKLLAKYTFVDGNGKKRTLYVQEARNKAVTAKLKQRAAQQSVDLALN